MRDEKAERRQATRVIFRATAVLSRYSRDMIPIEATVIDFSGLGCRFAVEPDSLCPGDRLRIDLRLPGHELPLVVHGRVIWARNEAHAAALDTVGILYTGCAAAALSHLCRICGNMLVERLNESEPGGSC